MMIFNPPEALFAWNLRNTLVHISLEIPWVVKAYPNLTTTVDSCFLFFALHYLENPFYLDLLILIYIVKWCELEGLMDKVCFRARIPLFQCPHRWAVFQVC